MNAMICMIGSKMTTAMPPYHMGKGIVRFVINKGMGSLLVYARPENTSIEIVDEKSISYTPSTQAFFTQDELLDILIEAEKIIKRQG